MNLSGEWIGRYIGHFDEVIRISQKGDDLEAWKITGDENVPAGEVTWKADLRTMRGVGQVAECEFRNPRFVSGRIVIMNAHRVVFHWTGFGSVEYRRDD